MKTIKEQVLEKLVKNQSFSRWSKENKTGIILTIDLTKQLTRTDERKKVAKEILEISEKYRKELVDFWED